MKKTNFTLFSRFGYAFGLFLMFTFGINQSVEAQCLPPTTLTTVSVAQTTASIRFTTANPPANLNCWVLSVGGAGMALGANNCPTGGQAIFTTTICQTGANTFAFAAPVTSVTRAGNQITVGLSSLAPGTLYNYFVSETCSNIVPPAVSDCAGPGVFTTLDAPFTASAINIVSPTCPFSSPGYVANGQFTINVVDSPTCPSTYTVQAAPVGGSGPGGSTPPLTTVTAYIGFGQGNFLFNNAGAGTYLVTVTANNMACNFATNPIVFNVVVPNGVDNVPPVMTISDLLGNTVATSPANVNLGNVILPEGSCGRQDFLFASLIDNCDGFVVAANAVSATATSAVAAPGTQVSVSNDGFGFYLIDIYWSYGSSTVTITGRDAQGNTSNVALTANVIPTVDPQVNILGNTQVIIPECENSVSLFYSAQAQPGCSQPYIAANHTFNAPGATAVLNFQGNNYKEFLVTFPAAGNYLLSTSYTDAFGNFGFFDVIVTVTKATSDDPALIVSGNGQFTVPACQANTFVNFSGTILDCNISPATPITAANITITGAPLTVTYIDNNNSFAYFEATGNLAPGTYLIFVTYAGITVDHLVSVVQDANQAATIVLPAVNVTIPQCQTSVTAVLSATIVDDCDAVINPANATFTLGGAPLTPSFVNPANGYFEFVVTLSAANSGALFTATYTDGGGLVTTTDAVIVVNAQPDLFAPIIVYPSQDISVDLDPCGPSQATINFEASAYDNCGLASFTLSLPPGANASIAPSAGGPTVTVVAGPGSYTLLLTATDIFGNVRQEDFTIVVTQAPAPPTNLICISHLNVTLDGECSATITPDMVLNGSFGCLSNDDFEVVINGDGNTVNGCGSYSYMVDFAEDDGPGAGGFVGGFAPSNWSTATTGVVGAASGLTFSPDLQTATLTLQAPSGNPRIDALVNAPSNGLLSFNWNFTSGDAGWTFFLFRVTSAGVVDVIQLGDPNSAGTTGAPGAASGSVTDLALESGDLLLFRLGNNVSIGATTTLTLTNWTFGGAAADLDINFQPCWGTINAEDKTPPTIEVGDCFSPLGGSNVFLGFMDAQNPIFNYAAGTTCLNFGGFNPPAGSRSYATVVFQPLVTGEYFIDGGNNADYAESQGLLPAGAANGIFWLTTDGDLALYTAPFDPNDVCANLIGGADGGSQVDPAPFQPGFAVNLVAGQTYYLNYYNWAPFVITQALLDALGNPLVIHTVTFSGPVLIEGPCSIGCTEIDDLLSATTVEQLRALNISDPITDDNCGVQPWTFQVGNLSSTDICADRTIPIYYFVSDVCGNTASTMRLVSVRRDELAGICDQLENYDGLENPAFLCDGTWVRDSNGNPSPYPAPGYAGTGAPDNQSCNIQCVYTDINIPICGPGSPARKILRRWTCIDWCLSDNQIAECTQILKIKDEVGPTITPRPLAQQVARQYDCEYDVRFNRPDVVDNCSDVVRISVSVTDANTGQVFSGDFLNTATGVNLQVVPRNIPPQPIPQPWRLTVGVHNVTYTAEDACGNVTVLEVPLELRDITPPTAICETFRVASLGSDCRVRIFAESFDDGSYDNCAIDRFTVRRMNPSPCYSPQSAALSEQPYVDFCCADIGASQDQRTVIFRVYDTSGNTNECMIFVEVQDKLLPVISCPPNITVDCRFHFGESDEELAAAFGRIILPTTAQPDPSVSPERRPRPELYDGLPWASSNRSGYINVAGQFLDGWANDNCSNAFAQCFLEVTVSNAISLECRQGAPNTQGKPFGVRRTFTVRDAAGNTATCTQFITVTNLFPFMGGTETFPGFYVGGALDRGYYRVFRQPTGTAAQINNALNLLNGWPGDIHAVPTGPYEGGEGVNPNPNGPQGIDMKVRYRVRPINTVYPTRWDIVWPADLMVTECGAGLSPDALAEDNLYRVGSRPFIQREDICAQVGIAYDEWEFDFDAGCKKIIRRWKVIDWCQENTVLNPWMWDQLIKLVDTEGPEITFGEYDPCVFENCNPDKTFRKTLTATAEDACLDDGNQIRWAFEVWAFGNPNVVVPASAFTVNRGADGRIGTISISANLPMTEPGQNSHIVKFVAEDGCGNKTTETYQFRIEDCKKPTPVCFNGLAADLMPTTGEVEIAASLFNAGSFDNCTPANELRFRLGRNVEVGQTTPPSTTSLLFTCDDIGSVEVAFWVGDNFGNWDYCVTYILIQNNMGADCGDGSLTGTVAGLIKMEDNNEGVEFADVINTATNVQGAYAAQAPLFNTVTIEPKRNDNPRNGVSTLDILLIQRHILGTEFLNTPYKLIAADANNSGSVTAADLVDIRRVLLGKIPNFTQNESWAFVPVDYEFPDMMNPWSEVFPRSYTIPALEEDMMDLNFVGIKVGDVNNSAKANSQSAQSTVSRSSAMEFVLNDIDMKAGNEYAIEFRSEDIATVDGYQFTFNFNTEALTFVGLEAGALNVSDDNFGFTMLDEGMITTSWNTQESVNLTGDDVLFTLRFRATQNIALSQAVSANSRFTEALAVRNNSEISLNLVFETGAGTIASDVYELYQNRPNPFANETIIGFSLPEAMNATITVFDVTGKIVKFINGDYAKGMNNIILKRTDLPASGVLYYQLEAGDFKATKKMVIIE